MHYKYACWGKSLYIKVIKIKSQQEVFQVRLVPTLNKFVNNCVCARVDKATSSLLLGNPNLRGSKLETIHR